MDDNLPEQTWKLKTYESYERNNTDTLTIWDYKHNNIFKKNLQLAEDNVDVEFEKYYLEGLFKDGY